MRSLLRPVRAAILLACLGSAAWASDDDCRVPMADWQPLTSVQALAREHGLTVDRIKIDDGCYQVKAHDPEGRAVEMRLQPATLEVLQMEHDDDD